MRILHCADLHIGFSAYQRLAPGGINAREADVAGTFARMIDAMIARAPDAIVVAGDVFHSAKPSNNAIMAAFRGFYRLVTALPRCEVVIAAGNHDLAKTSGGGSILQLIAQLGVHVADSSAMRFKLRGGLSVLAVPDVAGLDRPELSPDPSARYNVLVLHGHVQGVTQGGADRRPSLTEVSHEEMNPRAWDYVALGHYHKHEQIADNVAYSGSIDYTSSNPWQEIGTPKGFIDRNLSIGAGVFVALEPSREFVDVEPIYAAGLTPAAIDAAIADRFIGAIDNAVVRLIIHDVDRDVARALDQRAIRGYKARALNLNIDMRRPAPVEVGEVLTDLSGLSAADIGKRRRQSLFERLDQKVNDLTRDVAADVDRGALARLGAEYLDKVIADEEPSDTLEQQLRDSIDQPQQSQQLQGAA